MAQPHHHDHDDFGGLHRDLLATGAVMDRRGLFRMAASKIATSQIALPKNTCDLVYATAGYEASVTNPSHVTLATDNVFSDGSSLELS